MITYNKIKSKYATLLHMIYNNTCISEYSIGKNASPIYIF